MSVTCSFSLPTYKEPPMFLAAVREWMGGGRGGGGLRLPRETALFALV